MEDNDPAGYKSSKARKAKKELGYKIVSLPPSSPDLNPLDFFLWNDVERHMAKCAPKKRKESVDEFKVRLRKVAMSTSRVLLAKTMGSIRKRVAAIYKAEGHHIKLD